MQPDSTTKTCRACGETLPAAAFYAGRNSCKPCVCARVRSYAAANPEKVKARSKSWYARNGEYWREQVSIRRKAKRPEREAMWREVATDAGATKRCALCNETKPLDQFHADPDRRDGRARLCRPCDRPRSAAYRKANPDATAAVVRAWIKAHPARVRAIKAKWSGDHPESVAENRHRRRAQMRGQHVERVDFEAIWERDGGVCQICGEPVERRAPDRMRRPSLDHITPISRGGPHSHANVRLTHLGCNVRRGVGNPIEYLPTSH